jgi:hypothetical protein
MDWLTFLAEIAKAVAWPGAVTAVALLFRLEIKALLGRVKKGKLGPAEFEFEQGVKELKAEIPKDLPALPAPESQEPSTLRAIVEPRAVVLDAWLKVEESMNLLAMKHRVYNALAGPGSNYAATSLAKAGVLEPWALNIYRDLRRLRNQATHDASFSPSLESVLAYLQTASELTAELQRVANAA